MNFSTQPLDAKLPYLHSLSPDLSTHSHLFLVSSSVLSLFKQKCSTHFFPDYHVLPCWPAFNCIFCFCPLSVFKPVSLPSHLSINLCFTCDGTMTETVKEKATPADALNHLVWKMILFNSSLILVSALKQAGSICLNLWNKLEASAGQVHIQ